MGAAIPEDLSYFMCEVRADISNEATALSRLSSFERLRDDLGTWPITPAKLIVLGEADDIPC